jgi:iron complex outermembrane receptor protein
VLSYEVGSKRTWPERDLVLNIAAYLNDYGNQQQQITFPSGESVVSTVVNVASSRTYGLELDTQWAPGQGWLADASIGWLHTEVLKDSLGAVSGGALAVREGRGLTNAPKWIISAGLAKSWDLNDGSELKVSVDGRYTAERNFDLVETAEAPVWVTDPAYLLVNAVASYSFGRDRRYSIAVWGKNLTDELYFMNMQEFGIGTNIGFVGDPRTVGATFSVEF